MGIFSHVEYLVESFTSKIGHFSHTKHKKAAFLVPSLIFCSDEIINAHPCEKSTASRAQSVVALHSSLTCIWSNLLNRKLLTSEGYQRLQNELNDLVHKERPEITKIVSWAASLGDRSENADYIYNKKKLREIDRRIRYLTKLFEVAHKVEYSPEQDGKAYFGAWVALENDEGETIEFRIVGDEEIYGRKDYISLQSPMAKACLGKSINDEVTVQTPLGRKIWYINSIRYQSA